MENFENLGFSEVSTDEKKELNGGIVFTIVAGVAAYYYRDEIADAASDFADGFMSGWKGEED
ncbi:hypothetical protein [Marivirga sp.]|jgi:hypothetical protein|uniref:hypothetical protein n=1 Tax=Marivirga sp. TaxID=2018662 RepID=UPI003DA7A13C